MKVAFPEVLKPTAQRAPSEEELQEQPRPTSYKKQDSSFADVIEKTVEKTVEVVEKSVNIVDPLNIFAPNDIPTRLVMKEGLYTGASEEPYPILECRTLFSFHNLEAKSLKDGSSMVIEDSSGKTIVLIEREGEKIDAEYIIYKDSPTRDDQEPSKTTDQGQSMYLLARVDHASPTEFHVVMDNEVHPTYTMEKAGVPSNYATNYFIKKVGVKEEVASTHPWEKNTEMVVVDSGHDVTLMYCLAAIANDGDIVKTRKESFSELAEKVNPRTFVKKVAASIGSRKQLKEEQKEFDEQEDLSDDE